MTKNSGMDEMIPLKFFVSQNYPNPFKDKTMIKYCVGYKTKVRILIYNSEGEMIEKLIDEEKEAGTYEIEFKAFNWAEGIYLYQYSAGNYINTKKMILIKEK